MGDVGACPCVFTMRRRRYFEKQTNQEAAERPACRHDGCKCNGYGLGGQFCAAKCIAGSNRRRSSVHHGQTRRDHRPSCQSRQQHGHWLRHRRLSSRQKRGALHLPVPSYSPIIRGQTASTQAVQLHDEKLKGNITLALWNILHRIPHGQLL